MKNNSPVLSLLVLCFSACAHSDKGSKPDTISVDTAFFADPSTLEPGPDLRSPLEIKNALERMAHDSLVQTLGIYGAKVAKIISLDISNQSFLSYEGACSEAILVNLEWVNSKNEEHIQYFWVNYENGFWKVSGPAPIEITDYHSRSQVDVDSTYRVSESCGLLCVRHQRSWGAAELQDQTIYSFYVIDHMDVKEIFYLVSQYARWDAAGNLVQSEERKLEILPSSHNGFKDIRVYLQLKSADGQVTTVSHTYWYDKYDLIYKSL